MLTGVGLAGHRVHTGYQMKKALSVIVVSLAMSSCYMSNVYVTTTSITRAQYKTPSKGKATVHFLLLGRGKRGDLVSIYDGEKYIGTLTANQILSYQTKPGKKLFMDYFMNKSQADFLSLHLEAGKSYFVHLKFHSRAGYGLISLNDPVEIDKVLKKATNSQTVFVTPNEAGYNWDKENHIKVINVRSRYLKKWQAKQK